MEKRLEITQMFNEMVDMGYITPRPMSENTEDLRFPGELPFTPTIATYGTESVPASGGVKDDAKLGYCS